MIKNRFDVTTYQAAKKKTGLTYDMIVRDVRAGNIKPIYYLMGEESYYIDRVADFIVDTILRPEERDFNCMTFFGAETSIETIINTAKGFPMGAKFLVVVVKEAQNLCNLERLDFYLCQVQPSTVLIFCHKNGVLDRRKKITITIENLGVLFESKKLYESQLPTFIQGYLRRKHVVIDNAAINMMVDYIGADLNRMAGELDKLCIAIHQGENMITPSLVERHIGISKEFNIFELQDAFANKNSLKVFRIANYFDKNQKLNPIQKILPALFKFFSNLMLAYYSPDKSEKGLATWLGLTDWQVRRNVLPAMKRYSGVKVMNIISEIRRTDARSKGLDGPSTSGGELMRELFYYILR